VFWLSFFCLWGLLGAFAIFYGWDSAEKSRAICSCAGTMMIATFTLSYFYEALSPVFLSIIGFFVGIAAFEVFILIMRGIKRIEHE
jgi:hypothetical protein